MNLARHAAVLWRFRGVTAIGLLLGITLAVFASYQVAFKGGPSLKPRGSEVWTGISSILVTQPGFPEGRVTLPQRQIDNAVTADGQPAVAKNAPPQDQVEFADPGRLANLADLYSRFLTSAEVLQSVPGSPKQAQVQASPFAASANGQVLPIIQLTTNADSRENARLMNVGIYESLDRVLAERQTANSIAVGRRVEVKLIDPPVVTMTSGRSRTMSILALLMTIIGTLAVVHLLEAIRGPRKPAADKPTADRPAADELAAVAPWTPPGAQHPLEDLPAERRPRPERVGAGGKPRE